MPFSVADSDSFGNIVNGSAVTLIIQPTYVQYPDKFDNVVRTSKDGSIIVQTPTKDSRTRKWFWRNYKSNTPKYNALFSQILQFDYKLRLAQGKSPWVYVQDTETLNLGVRTFNGTIWVESFPFIRVKVVQVTQNIAQQSGYPTYGETVFEFYIDDPSFNNF